MSVEQEVRLYEIADASRQRIKPIYVAVDGARKGRTRIGQVLADVCPVNEIANANDPGTHLVIIAKLTTTGETAGVRRDGCAVANVSDFEVPPCPTDVAANVKPSPIIDRRWRQYGGLVRWLPRQIGCRSYLSNREAQPRSRDECE